MYITGCDYLTAGFFYALIYTFSYFYKKYY